MDEERGDAADRAHVAATGQREIESLHPRGDDLVVSVEGEDQRDVHVDAGPQYFGDGGQALFRPRDLDHHVVPSYFGRQSLRGGDRGHRVASQSRRHLERHVAVAVATFLRGEGATGRGVYRSEHVTSVTNVTDREFFEEHFDVHVGLTVEHLFVGRRRREGLGEDRRIGRHAAYALHDHSGERAVVQPVPSNVVDPGTLSVLGDEFIQLGHALPPNTS